MTDTKLAMGRDKSNCALATASGWRWVQNNITADADGHVTTGAT